VAVDIKGEKMRTGEFTPESRIVQHKKDVELILAYATALGQELPLSQVHHRLLIEAIEAGEGELDNAAIIQSIRRQQKDK
jgi:3-hydroxyisobutyrate dehydrogenase-like beta-hydroxyacid dehydrogenase